MNSENIFLALKNIKKTIDINKDEIEKLDQAIGDGDHIFNIQRGLNEALKLETELSSLSPEEVFKKIGDLPYLSQSLILHSKVKRSLQDFESSMDIAREAIEISTKINSEEFIHHSQIEKEITSMYISKSSDSLLSFSLIHDNKLNDESLAYIHFNLWKYAKLKKSKAIALNLYQKLYKRFPKYSYKIYIDKLT